jgi:hypothetical protein
MAVLAKWPRQEPRVVGNPAYFDDHISQVTDCYRQMDDEIIQYSNDSGVFPTITQIEQSYSEMRNRIWLLDSEHLSDIIENLDESKLIKLTREKYNQVGIRLKTNLKTPITIQTEDIKIKLKRYVLIPFSEEDKIKLLEIENKKAIYPLDEALGINKLPFKITVNGMLKICKCALRERSFKEAANVLLDYNQIKIDPVTIMDVTNHIGEIVYNNEFKIANINFTKLLNGTIKIPTQKYKDTLYIQIDGAMVNLRSVKSENKGNEAKQSTWSENKLALIYSSNNVNITGRIEKNGKYEDRHRITKKSYTSYIGEVAEFKKLLFSCALQSGYGEYKHTVLLSDGATWIRNLKEDLFPDAQQILDFYHLSEKIWDFGKIYYNKNEKKYIPFCHAMCDKLKESNYTEVIDTIKRMELKFHNKNELKPLNLSNYMVNNIKNIDYKTYINKGFIIGSGAIESSNKSVMQYRLKQPGMRWTLNSARYMVMLRAIHEGGQWYEKVILPVYDFYGIKPN